MKRLYAILLAVVILSVAGCASAEKSKAEVSETRAYRTADELDPDLPSDNIDFVTDIYMMSDPDLQKQAFEALTIVNDERSNQGLAPLMWDSRLETDAATRVQELASMFDKDHNRPDGRYWYTLDPGYLLGESIYKGKGEASKVMEAWMNNPADKENFLSPDITKMAISIFEEVDGTAYWAALFAADTD